MYSCSCLLFNIHYNGNDANNTLSTSDAQGSGPVHLVGSHCVEKFAEEIEDEGEEEEEESQGEEATDDKAESK